MQVFVLFEIEELSMAEAAAVVGCPLFTAYARHKTARARIEAFFRKRSRR
jgi:RNA polymerase sigma-70 factor (ECF subfamily)